MRWLAFRIMLGAGPDQAARRPCWTHLTCLDWHFETQPIPNPLSPLFHHLPHAVHAGGVVFNHVVEVVAPLFVFGPRRLRLVAGVLDGRVPDRADPQRQPRVPQLADARADPRVLRRRCVAPLCPRRVREWLRARIAPAEPRDGRQLAMAMMIGGAVVLAVTSFGLVARRSCSSRSRSAVVAVALSASRLRTPGTASTATRSSVGVFAALVIVKSWPVVDNLTSKHQAMNTELRPARAREHLRSVRLGRQRPPRAGDRGHARRRSGARDLEGVRAAVQAGRPRSGGRACSARTTAGSTG